MKRKLMAGFLIAIVGCRSAQHPQCEATGQWQTSMLDSLLDYRMGGRVTLASPLSSISFEDTTAEGTVDGGTFSVDSIRIAGDSIAFVFAPARVKVWGRCINTDSISGRFVYANWDPTPTGIWSMRRIKKK